MVTSPTGRLRDVPALSDRVSRDVVTGGTDWAGRLEQLLEKTAGLLDDVDRSWPDDRALFAADATATLVEANRVFQSLTDHLEPIADAHSTAWREPVVSVLIPVEQRGVERVAVPTGDEETTVVPVGTDAGGRAWTERSMSLADLDRWRDRTLTRRSEHPSRRRGASREAVQLFLPPTVLRDAFAQLEAVLEEVSAAVDLDVRVPDPE